MKRVVNGRVDRRFSDKITMWDEYVKELGALHEKALNKPHGHHLIFHLGRVNWLLELLLEYNLLYRPKNNEDSWKKAREGAIPLHIQRRIK